MSTETVFRRPEAHGDALEKREKMSKSRTFFVKAVWDDEAKIYYSESDIIGLHLESKTLEKFEELVMELARELIIENHISNEDLHRRSVFDMIPAIHYSAGNMAVA